MSWVDTHCHLQLDERDSSELLARAEDVKWLVVPGIDASSSQAAVELARQNPDRVAASAGLHPHDASRWPKEGEQIQSLATEAIAIGETGLDFYRNLSDAGAQRQAFKAQIDLALELAKPLIVHCRDAFSDIYEVVESAAVGPQTIMHCWTGGPRWTRRFLDLGVYFSFAGPLAFETGDTVRRGAELVPPGRAMVETDTPYLAPPPHRGERNEPAWVRFNGAALARVWGLPIPEVARLTSETAASVFEWPG